MAVPAGGLAIGKAEFVATESDWVNMVRRVCSARASGELDHAATVALSHSFGPSFVCRSGCAPSTITPAVCGVLGACAGCGECGAAWVSADFGCSWHQIGWVSVVQVSRPPCCHATRPGGRGWLSFLVAMTGGVSAWFTRLGQV